MNRYLFLYFSLGFVLSITQLSAELKGPLPLRPIPDGEDRLGIFCSPYNIEVYTYKPANFSPRTGSMLIVFHGHSRNPHDYLEHAKPLADKHGLLLLVPDFNEKQFPSSAYNDGGVIENGVVQPKNKWAFNVVPELVDRIRHLEGNPLLPYYLLGHSAGGQFVERLMAFESIRPVRAVAANPGSHMLPSRELHFPYGFAGLPKALGDDAAIRAYLAKPLTLYLGTADINPNDPLLDKSKSAEKEGPYRLARGHHCFEVGKQTAQALNAPFNWRLVQGPGVGHDATKMFSLPQCEEALFGRVSH